MQMLKYFVTCSVTTKDTVQCAHCALRKPKMWKISVFSNLNLTNLTGIVGWNVIKPEEKHVDCWRPISWHFLVLSLHVAPKIASGWTLKLRNWNNLPLCLISSFTSLSAGLVISSFTSISPGLVISVCASQVSFLMVETLTHFDIQRGGWNFNQFLELIWYSAGLKL